MTQSKLPNGEVHSNGATLNNVKVSCDDPERFQGVIRPYSMEDVQKLR